MSADRPPSQDSIGGDGTKTSKITTTTTIINSTVTTSTTTANMVLSAIPLDSGHVVIQQSAPGSRIATLTNSPSTHLQHHHHQQQQQQQLQQHIQQQQQNGSSNGVITTANFTQQINRNNISPSKIITTTGGGGHNSVGHHSITKIIGTSNGSGGGSSTTSSKYVIFQPNGHYTTNDAFINQSNGVGNIVIVATEPMDISHPEQHQQLQHHQQITAATSTTILNTNSNGGIGTTDEELTSLTWLTDKNLIKGLVACTNKTTGTAQGLGNSPGRQINCINNNNHVGSSNISNGNVTPLSPTSDFMEDSSVSDENLSSANSSTTDQGICVRQNITNEYSTAIHLHKSQQQQHHIQYTNNNKYNNNNNNNSNNNNNTINKNRNNIISPINTNNSVNFTTNTSSNNNLIQQLQEHSSHHLNGNLSAALGATTTVHVGPSGTTTVVEYKSSNQNHLQSSVAVTPTTTVRHISNQQQQVPHSTTINSSSSNLLSTISPITQQQQNNKTLNNSFNPIVITSSTIPKSQNLSTSTVSSVPLVVSTITTIPTPTTTTIHHPHKKYLREQMNGFDHQQNGNNNINNNNVSTTNSLNVQYSAMPSTNIIPYSGSGTGNGVNSITSSKINNNQSMLTIASESPPREYLQQQHSTPNKYAEYDNDSLKDFELPNGTLSSSSSSNGRISSNAQKQNNTSSGSLSPSKQKHPTNMPYDPYVHTNSKPPYSFSSLIFMAIEDSPEKALPVKEIYAWIVHHFPYFKTAPTGWKNSVRHNLSLNKSFLKVEKAPNMGKGSLWRVEQLQRPNLIQALARSPFHPCSAIDKHLQQHKNNQITNSSSVKYTNTSSGMDSPPMTPVKSNLDARLFPKLSKMIREIITKGDSTTSESLGIMDNDGTDNFNNNNNTNILNKNNSNNNNNNIYYKNNCINTNTGQYYENVERLARDCGVDSIDDVNAATAMLALKHGPKVFTETFNNGSPVITNSPSEDHTYSAGGGSSVNNGGVVGNIVIVASSGVCSSNSSVTGQIGSQNGSDNVSNGISSDAAYESSEESHNITAEELEEQRRVEGVDALLSLSSMFDISATPSPSPIKRPSSSIIEEEHISSYMENIPHLNGKGILAANSTIDEGYNTPASYYSHLISNSNVSSVSLSVSLPKKLKQSRGIRAKIKRKTAWIR